MVTASIGTDGGDVIDDKHLFMKKEKFNRVEVFQNENSKTPEFGIFSQRNIMQQKKNLQESNSTSHLLARSTGLDNLN